MKKIIITILLCGVIVLAIIGCWKANKSATINVTLRGDSDSIEIRIGDILTYSLLGHEYEFKITDITKNKISIEVNQYGLTNTSSLLAEDNKFVIEKGEKLELHTQSTDYQEKITFEYPDCDAGKPTKISKQTYTFTDNNCDIRISYPKIEQAEYKTTNNELYTISTSQWMEANGLEKKNLDAVVEYDVTTFNEHIISVKFTGYYMVKGAAHPVDICFASSIDLEHQKPLEIFDFISYESAFQCVQDGNVVIEYGGLKALSFEEQSSRIGNVLMEKDSHNMMQIYIEKENLYFIVGNLSHALGDYSIVCFSETQK